ncbi:MAG: hypothetical protein LBM72_02585 [Mycoplasmataceae bacterium]|jgi:tRNA-binding protein|nr:hypothetical protein [Mycoplasmataceae bacterium]
MLAIFYNKTSLKDTLIINANKSNSVSIKTGEDFTYGLNEKQEVTFINIFNVSKKINLPDGYLHLYMSMIDMIKHVTGISLTYDEYPVVVGKVNVCNEIAGTHLHECKVDVGDRELNIVCGAKNIKAGLSVPVAMIGAILPNGLSIKPGKIMNRESNGMICSAAELDLKKHSFNTEGIIELPTTFKVGEPFMQVFNN